MAIIVDTREQARRTTKPPAALLTCLLQLARIEMLRQTDMETGFCVLDQLNSTAYAIGVVHVPVFRERFALATNLFPPETGTTAFEGAETMGRMKRGNLNDWVRSEQGKHLCNCGCNELVIVQRHHHTRGIPDYINHHSMRVSNPMSGRSGELNPHYNTGRHVTSDGYIVVLNPNRTGNNNKYIREHRLIMEIFLGRQLTRQENVHHIDGNKINNQLSNLELLDVAEHSKRHMDDLREKIGEVCYTESRKRWSQGKPYRSITRCEE